MYDHNERMRNMVQALKQAWWAPLAGLLVLAQLALSVANGAGGEDAESKSVAVAIALAGAIVLAAGLFYRPRARGLGNALIIVGALLAAFWFWTLVLPVVALIVVIGVVTSEIGSRSRAAEHGHGCGLSPADVAGEADRCRLTASTRSDIGERFGAA